MERKKEVKKQKIKGEKLNRTGCLKHIVNRLGSTVYSPWDLKIEISEIERIWWVSNLLHHFTNEKAGSRRRYVTGLTLELITDGAISTQVSFWSSVSFASSFLTFEKAHWIQSSFEISIRLYFSLNSWQMFYIYIFFLYSL